MVFGLHLHLLSCLGVAAKSAHVKGPITREERQSFQTCESLEISSQVGIQSMLPTGASPV